MKFSGWLRQAREDRSMSRTALAKALGIHDTTVKNYESGYSGPDDETVAAIAKLFNADFLDLWLMIHEKEHPQVAEALKGGFDSKEVLDAMATAGAHVSPRIAEICSRIAMVPEPHRTKLLSIMLAMSHLDANTLTNLDGIVRSLRPKENMRGKDNLSKDEERDRRRD